MNYRHLTSLRFPFKLAFMAALIMGAGPTHAGSEHPLEPVDTSSPRATLTSFITEMEDVWLVFRDSYWDAPDYAAYQYLMGRAARILRTLDLSEVAPSARIEVGHQGAMLLWEILTRIELPPLYEIPDATAYVGTDGPAKWTIPHTDITIARITDGTRKGEFLFSAGTVDRLEEFYERIRELPYTRDVPIEDTAGLRQLHGGWWVAMSSIERLPAWMRVIVFNHAIWKWGAFAILVAVASLLVMLVFRVSRRSVSESRVHDYLRRLATPLVLLLMIPGVAYLITGQINLIH